MRMLNFKNSSGVIETIVSSDKVAGIQVTDADTVVVTVEVGGSMGTAGVNVGFDKVTITATAKASEVANRLAEYVAASNIGGANLLTIANGVSPFAEVSVVLYAAVA